MRPWSIAHSRMSIAHIRSDSRFRKKEFLSSGSTCLLCILFGLSMTAYFRWCTGLSAKDQVLASPLVSLST
jgi:hypothetical protein